MEGQYAVMLHGRQVGKVQVKKQGLYYGFHCRCCLTEHHIYRLEAVCGAVKTYLGILVPQEGSFVLDTRKPAKGIGEGTLQFTLSTKEEGNAGHFVPICPEEPFAYIARLKESFLVLREGKPGIYITERQA